MADARDRYGCPYGVAHRSDLDGTLLREAERLVVDLATDRTVVRVEQYAEGPVAFFVGAVDCGAVVHGRIAGPRGRGTRRW